MVRFGPLKIAGPRFFYVSLSLNTCMYTHGSSEHADACRFYISLVQVHTVFERNLTHLTHFDKIYGIGEKKVKEKKIKVKLTRKAVH